MTGKRFYVKKITREERPRLFSSIGADYKYWIVDRMARGDGTGLGDAELRFNFSTEKRKADNVCDLLNELHEQLETCKDANTRCCNEYSAMRRDVLRYKEENEQLKRRNKKLKKHLRKFYSDEEWNLKEALGDFE